MRRPAPPSSCGAQYNRAHSERAAGAALVGLVGVHLLEHNLVGEARLGGVLLPLARAILGVEDALLDAHDAQQRAGPEEHLRLLLTVEAQLVDGVASLRLDREDGARPRPHAAKVLARHHLAVGRGRLELVPTDHLAGGEVALGVVVVGRRVDPPHAALDFAREVEGRGQPLERRVKKLCIGHDRAHRRRDGAPLAARALGEHGAVERRVHVGRLVERVRVDAERKVHERVGKADLFEVARAAPLHRLALEHRRELRHVDANGGE
mmetsp:Transcript_58170/g.152821  ORF Transcript_58170/g.152821 Transcript_58170/m.152821 type:complete len:265 (+) Transcript_58170:104-898(+)